MADAEVTLDEISVTLAPDAQTPGGGADSTKTTPETSQGETQQSANTSTSTESTSSTVNTLSNGDLPWAKVALPTTSAGQGGNGEGRHGLQPETWVYGIFLDGDSKQQPLILGVISRGPGGGSGRGGSGDGSGGGTDTGTGGVTGDYSGSGGKNTGGTGGDNAVQAYDQLVRAGYSPQNAAGIMGNLLNEGKSPKTGDISPTQNQIGGGGGYGIGQWTDPGRKAALRNYTGSNINTIQGQVSFLIHELKTSEKVAERLLQNSRNSVAQSTIAFMNWEKPQGYLSGLAKRNGGNGIPPGNQKAKDRIKTAEAFYAKMQSRGATKTSTPTTTQGARPTNVSSGVPNGNFALTGVTAK